MATTTKLHHTIASVIHIYYEMLPDGTRILRHIEANRRPYQMPADGNVTVGIIPDDSVGTEQIKDGTVQRQDLHDEVKNSLVGDYTEETETLTFGQ